ncbi:MAG: hypothetical protein ACE5Q6_03855 [Dehalococcoidia bacterium]
MSPSERSIRARIGALSLHAQGRTNTAPARAKFMEKFIDQIDPKRVLPEPERLRRAELARKAYFSKLALRRGKKSARRG